MTRDQAEAFLDPANDRARTSALRTLHVSERLDVLHEVVNALRSESTDSDRIDVPLAA